MFQISKLLFLCKPLCKSLTLKASLTSQWIENVWGENFLAILDYDGLNIWNNEMELSLWLIVYCALSINRKTHFVLFLFIQNNFVSTFTPWHHFRYHYPKSHLLIHNECDSLLTQNAMNLVWHQQINYIKIMNWKNN